MIGTSLSLIRLRTLVPFIIEILLCVITFRFLRFPRFFTHKRLCLLSALAINLHFHIFNHHSPKMQRSVWRELPKRHVFTEAGYFCFVFYSEVSFYAEVPVVFSFLRCWLKSVTMSRGFAFKFIFKLSTGKNIFTFCFPIHWPKYCVPDGTLSVPIRVAKKHSNTV